MHKHPFLIAVTAAFFALGCDGFDVNVSEFESLCLASGGTLHNGSGEIRYNQCFCGQKNEIPCAQGAVCVDRGLHCSSAGPQAGTACHNALDVCANGLNTTSDNAGRMMICRNEQWSYGSECMINDKPVSCRADNSGCGQCLNDSVTCKDEKTLIRCAQGIAFEEPCIWGCKTVNGVDQCTDKIGESCERDETICEDINGIGLIQTCQNGLWQSETCNNVSCKGEGCGECINQTSVCTNDEVRRCVNGTWSAPFTCQSGCDEKGTDCLSCKNNYYLCKDSSAGIGIISKCQDNTWSEQENLNPNQSSCMSTYPDKELKNILGECQNYATRCWCGNETCEDTERNILQICNNGRWNKLTECLNCTETNNKAACTRPQSTALCEEFTYQCDGNQRQQCRNGIWEPIQACTYGCNDVTLECNACPNGSMRFTSQSDATDIDIELCSDNAWNTISTCAITTESPFKCACESALCIKLPNAQGILLPCMEHALELIPMLCPKGCKDNSTCNE